MTEVRSADLARHVLNTDTGEIPFDFLIVSAGSATNFFGVASAEERVLGLKDLRDATAVRNHVLRQYERANVAPDTGEWDRLMTCVVVGGGPTGVELAGAMGELKRHVLPHDYPDLDLSRAQVILLEATDRLLSALPERLGRKAAEQLATLGVDVRFGATVAQVVDDGVVLQDGTKISAATVVWVAGVRGEALAERMGVETAPGRRVRVLPTMQAPGHPSVYVIGDMAYFEAPNGRPYPMVAPVAMQQAKVAAQNVIASLRGDELRTFKYKDRGTMATVGRRMAVADVFGLQFTGFVAWILWLTLHLIQLVGLRNRAIVLFSWAWNYFRYDRANRLVTDYPELEPSIAAPSASRDGESSAAEAAGRGVGE
jgi:NADH dehydrogenase